MLSMLNVFAAFAACPKILWFLTADVCQLLSSLPPPTELIWDLERLEFKRDFLKWKIKD
jgi:hypothetical protein